MSKQTGAFAISHIARHVVYISFKRKATSSRMWLLWISETSSQVPHSLWAIHGTTLVDMCWVYISVLLLLAFLWLFVYAYLRACLSSLMFAPKACNSNPRVCPMNDDMRCNGVE